jgi:SAM-dependent methyltransferase
MFSPHLLSRVNEILVCPSCRAGLRFTSDSMLCSGCGASFSLQDGVPVFLSGPVENLGDHASNAIGAEFEALLDAGLDFILHIGAGGSPKRFPNCVEFEHKIFRHTDVVGDAHQLPFRDNVFDRVFALNVFEHLRDPKTAAMEILRVLKPGGAVAIHTAFLQPLHEGPHHFYNATEFGVREWFTAFEIESCRVSGNFGPGMMLAFLSANILEVAAAASAEQQAQISQTTIGDWAQFWRNRTAPPVGFETLQAEQARVAAGFELVARKTGGPPLMHA